MSDKLPDEAPEVNPEPESLPAYQTDEQFNSRAVYIVSNVAVSYPGQNHIPFRERLLTAKIAIAAIESFINRNYCICLHCLRVHSKGEVLLEMYLRFEVLTRTGKPAIKHPHGP